MLVTLSRLIRPLAGVIFFIMGASLFTTYVTIRLDHENFSVITIGVISTIYYGGIFIGALYSEKLITYFGHPRVFVLSSFLFGGTAIAMAFYLVGWYWAILRFIAGICTAGIYVASESWLVIESSPKTRGRILSFYMISFYTASAIGQFFLNFGTVDSPYVFSMVLILSFFSLACVTNTPPSCPTQYTPSPLKLKKLMRSTPLGTIGALLSGMLMAVAYTLIPIFGNDIGLSLSQIALLMFTIISGGLILQWPLGKLSDTFDRRIIIVFTAAIGFGLCMAIIFLQTYLLFTLAALFGGFIFALYPLSTAHACDLVAKPDLVKAIGALVLSYGFGAVIGPCIAPLFMLYLGSSGLFYFFSFILIIFALIALIAMLRRPAVPSEDKTHYFPLTKTSEGAPLQIKKIYGQKK